MMRWDDLTIFQLRELGRWLDWAEHHAMNEFGRAVEEKEYSNKVMWNRELKTLSDTQVQLRDLELKLKMNAA